MRPTDVDEVRLEAILHKLSQSQRADLLAGASMWETVAVPRANVPAIRVTDGPNGARGSGSFAGGLSAACFPAGISLGSTWNPALVARVGAAIAEEARSKGATVLLAPTVNIHRHPLNGRNFECYAEDPHLSAQIAIGYITGVQGVGVGATVKHFVGNDSEHQRYTMSSDIDERALREIYLVPFEAAVCQAGAWAVMTGYNRLNGVYCCDNHWLLRDVLKGEWGFDGLVMSDWFGTKSTVEAAANGLDLEMPGPTIYRGAALQKAVRQGKVPRAAIDDSVRRLLRTIDRVGAFEAPALVEEQAIDRPEHRALIREAAIAGSVLLKNAGDTLPLPTTVRKLAVIGPNSDAAVVSGGGSARLFAHHTVKPLDGIRARAGDGVGITHEFGCSNHRYLPLVQPELLTDGWTATYFASPEPDGAPYSYDQPNSGEQIFFGSAPGGLRTGEFSARYSGVLVPDVDGPHQFSLLSAGRARLFVDGKLVVDNWDAYLPGAGYFGFGSDERTGSRALQARTPIRIDVDYSSSNVRGLGALRVGMLRPQPADAIEHAAIAAAGADAAIVIVGGDHEWESEGIDRDGIALRREQDALIAAVAQANPRTIVVLQSGGPVAMPWLDEVAAVLQVWFGGQEIGDAIAAMLFGDEEPGGRLPQTFPARLEDYPAVDNNPGVDGHVAYTEGIFVGYRHYDARGIAPLFPFGFGLGYTTFAMDEPRLTASSPGRDATITVRVDVTNTGRRRGREVVPAYVVDPVASVPRPPRELKGFAGITLDPGETGTVEIALDRRAFAWWDMQRHAWVAEGGEYVIEVGRSSRDIAGRASFGLRETVVFAEPLS